MSAPTPHVQAIKVPDFVGFQAVQGILMLRELGLLAVTWPGEVEDVSEVGFVIGLDPPPGTLIRARALIAVCVGVQPDPDGQGEELLGGRGGTLAEPPGPVIGDRLVSSRTEAAVQRAEQGPPVERKSR